MFDPGKKAFSSAQISLLYGLIDKVIGKAVALNDNKSLGLCGRY